jgi:hypothetical protein
MRCALRNDELNGLKVHFWISVIGLLTKFSVVWSQAVDEVPVIYERRPGV